jgi:hypothetical protein
MRHGVGAPQNRCGRPERFVIPEIWKRGQRSTSQQQSFVSGAES